MKAARIVKPREPLEIKPPKPNGPQVLNKVHSVGICHSDIHLWEDGYEALTSYGAVKNANLAPSDKVVSAGAGGLGLMAIQLAKPATGARIIAMDLDDEKLKLVKQNRTDNNINSKNKDAGNVVIELSNKLGADAVIDLVNVSKTVAVAQKKSEAGVGWARTMS